MEPTSTSIQSDDLMSRHGAYIAVIRNHAFLRITGADATRWLNGMVTNSIQSLRPGEANYNFLLNAQGRIQGDCTIYRQDSEAPAFLLATSTDQIETLQTLLDRFIIMDDVEIARACEGTVSLLVLGLEAPLLLENLGLPVLPALHLASIRMEDEDLLILSPSRRQSPQFELIGSTGLVSTLAARATASGAKTVDDEDLRALRILEGEPVYSVDIRDRDLPQETNQTHALHFAKGCYLGQEIVERIRSRGQVHRLLTPFELQGSMPDLPAPIEANGKPAGELTSAVQVGEAIYALGYARREALEAKVSFTYSGGTATPRTTATSTRIQQHEKTNG